MLFSYHQAILTETLYITWVLLTLLFLVLSWKNMKWHYFLLAGIAAAGAQYVRPIFTAFPLFIAAVTLIVPKYRKKTHIPYLLIFIIAWLAFTIPWNIRNYYVLGDWKYFSTKGGFNLLIGNNPMANGTQISSNTIRPPLDGEYLYNFYTDDELERDKDATRKALDFISHNPIQWLKLSITKITYLWTIETRDFLVLYSQSKWQKSTARLFILILGIVLTSIPFIIISIIFLRSLFMNKSPAALIILSFIIYTTLLAMIFFGDPRHHLPCIPLMALFSAYYIVNRKRVQLSNNLRKITLGLIILLFLTSVTYRTVINMKTSYHSMMTEQQKW